MAMGCSLREQSKSCLAINWCTYSSMIICIGTHDQQIDGSTGAAVRLLVVSTCILTGRHFAR